MQKLHRRGDIDMTQGNEFRHILNFALPLLLGNIFQQLYNTVDTWVVGNHAGTTAFSAVGTVGLSTGITRELVPLSRLLLIFLMYMGRLGSITVVMAVAEKKNARIMKPVEKIVIG